MQGDPKLDELKRKVKALHDAGAPDSDIEEFLEASGHPKLSEREERDDRPRPRGASLASVAKGATFGFADEALGAVEGANQVAENLYNKVRGRPSKGGGFKEGYERGTRKVRDVTEAFEHDHPVGSEALEIAGGAIPIAASVGGSVAKAAAKGGAALVRKSAVKEGAKVGAKYGALSGAGNSEGGVVDRAKGAAKGGAAGAVLGAVAGAVPGAVRTVRNMVGAHGKKSAGKLADDLLTRALERDEIAPEQLGNAAREARAGGKPEILPDLAGENTMGLARAAQATPSKAKDALTKTLHERHEGQLSRITSDLETSLRTGQKDVHEVAEQLIEKRRTTATPLYESAYAKGEVDDPEIVRAFELPQFRQAYKVGQRIARTEGVKLPPLVDAIEQYGADAAGKIAKPTVQALDYTKRGLDDMIEARMRSGKMGRSEARALRQRLDAMLERVDAAVPEYKAAREAYAGDSRLMEALEKGKGFLSNDARVSAAELAAMTDSERELYRVGAQDAVRRAMEKAQDGRDLTKTIFGSPDKRAKLRVLYPDDKSFAAFEKSLEREGRMVRSKDRIVGGSPTARIQGEVADMSGNNAGEAALRGLPFGWKGAAAKAGAAFLHKRVEGIRGNVADELSQRMLMNPLEIEAYLARLRGRAPSHARARVHNTLTQKLLGQGAGAEVGGSSSTRK